MTKPKPPELKKKPGRKPAKKSPPKNQPVPQQPESQPGFLQRAKNLLSPPQPSQPESQPVFSVDSPISSTGSPDPLSPESQRLLAQIPDRIEDDPNPEQGPGGPAEAPDADPIAAMMAGIAIEQEDVRDLAEWFFEFLAGRFESEHWKLTESQANRLAKPAAVMLNAIWLKLQSSLPDVITRWLEQTPGAMGLLFACGFIVVPRITRQVAISKERRQAARVPAGTTQQNKKPPQPAAAPATVDGIPSWKPEFQQGG